MKTQIEFVPGSGYVHSRFWSKDPHDGWKSWIKCRSERHADRLVRKLNWWTIANPAPGGFFRHTYFDPWAKRLVTSAGYDV